MPHSLLLLLLTVQTTLAKQINDCLPPAPKIQVEPVEGPGAADILFIVDTSGSMGSEATNVANNLNAFGSHLEKEGIDYHLIVVAQDMGSVRLCVKTPVADKDCGLIGDRFLKTNTPIYSTDAMKQMVDPAVYDKYKAKLRKDSGKTFVFVSDDKITGTFGCGSVNCKTDVAKAFFAKLQEIDVDGYFAPTPKLSNGVMVHSVDGHDCMGEPGRHQSYSYKGVAEQTGGKFFHFLRGPQQFPKTQSWVFIICLYDSSCRILHCLFSFVVSCSSSFTSYTRFASLFRISLSRRNQL